LDYGQKTNAYYIKCHECREDYADDPESQFWKEWLEDIRRAEYKVEQKYAILAKMET
jgi:SWI/SNF-related matrix-associated actin-dependent regulator of chromatin subfamily A member 5